MERNKNTFYVNKLLDLHGYDKKLFLNAITGGPSKRNICTQKFQKNKNKY